MFIRLATGVVIINNRKVYITFTTVFKEIPLERC